MCVRAREADTCCISLFPDVCITMMHYWMTYCVSSLNTHKHTFQSQHSPYPTPECRTKNLNSTAGILDLQALTITPQKWKEAISEPFKGWKEIFYTQWYNTLRYTQCRGGISNKVLTDSVGFFSSASVFLPSGHLSLIPVAIVIRYVNDLSLSQMQQINQGQWVPFRTRMGEGGET